MRVLILSCIVSTLLITGCASKPPKEGKFRQLNGGTPDTVFAGDLPVESAAEAIARGDEQLARGKPDHAVYYYVRALDFDAKDGKTFQKIGLIHLRKGDAQRAESAFRLALDRDPDLMRSQEGLGLILLRRRDYTTARTLLEGAAKSAPRAWQAEDGLGALADLRGDFDEARRHYEAAVAANPGSAQVRNNFGYSRYLAGDWEGAEAQYRRAIQLDPRFRQAWQNLGQLKVRQGDLEGAFDAFSQILEPAEAENNVGYLCMISGDYPTAERWFRRAIKTSPRYYPTAERNLEQLRRRKPGEGGTVSGPIKTAER